MNRIEELEKTARQLEPDTDIRSKINQKVIAYTDYFIETLPEAPGFTEGVCSKVKSLSIGEKGKPFHELLSLLSEEVDVTGINSASGAHLGYIPGGGLWTSAIADMLAAVTNRYAGIAYSSPGALVIENQLIRWLSSVVGYSSEAHGNLSSGGSISNQIAVQTARDFHQVNSDVVRHSVIYVTGQTHHSIHKALRTTGLHEAVLRTIPVNDRYQMDTSALEHQVVEDKKNKLKPFLVIATAGTTDTGAVDPLDSIADICFEENLWFHVDAAYGGFFLLVDEMKETFKGIERSDSVVLDPHKTLFIPYGTGIVLIKNREALLTSFSSEAGYMKDACGQDEISPADSGPELSKHFRGLRIWLPLHVHGLQPFRASLEEKLLLCRFFHNEIQKMGFQTGPYPNLSVTMFRYSDDDKNKHTQKLVDALHADGRFFFSSTVINNQLWIRCAVVSFRTHLREIKLALSMIREIAEKLN